MNRKALNSNKTFTLRGQTAPIRVTSKTDGHAVAPTAPRGQAVAPMAPRGPFSPATLPAARERRRRTGGMLGIHGCLRREGQGAGAERQSSHRDGHDTGKVKG